jgi:hypothetical protein
VNQQQAATALPRGVVCSNLTSFDFAKVTKRERGATNFAAAQCHSVLQH